MTRVMKGANNGWIPRLICIRAKAGTGCEYRTVKLPDVERELIDRAEELKPPSVDVALDEEIEALRDELRELDDVIRTLVDTIERSPSAALSNRLAAREKERQKISAAPGETQSYAADRRSTVVQHRTDRLIEQLKRLREDPSILPAANAALRECLDSIVVDYDAHELRLQWRHGGAPSLIKYAVAELFGPPIGQEKHSH